MLKHVSGDGTAGYWYAVAEMKKMLAENKAKFGEAKKQVVFCDTGHEQLDFGQPTCVICNRYGIGCGNKVIDNPRGSVVNEFMRNLVKLPQIVF